MTAPLEHLTRASRRRTESPGGRSISVRPFTEYSTRFLDVFSHFAKWSSLTQQMKEGLVAMKRTSLSAATLAIVSLIFAWSLPSSAGSLSSPGAALQMRAISSGSNGIEPVSHIRYYWGDRFYGQWWAWGYRYYTHRRDKVHVSRSRYAYGCGYYNCYSGARGDRNRVPFTSGKFRYQTCDGTCSPVYSYPEPGFGVVIH
jgi:hypothetical protein